MLYFAVKECHTRVSAVFFFVEHDSMASRIANTSMGVNLFTDKGFQSTNRMPTNVILCSYLRLHSALTNNQEHLVLDRIRELDVAKL